MGSSVALRLFLISSSGFCVCVEKSSCCFLPGLAEKTVGVLELPVLEKRLLVEQQATTSWSFLAVMWEHSWLELVPGRRDKSRSPTWSFSGLISGTTPWLARIWRSSVGAGTSTLPQLLQRIGLAGDLLRQYCSSVLHLFNSWNVFRESE